MITLYGFRAPFGLPDPSPVVTRAETCFRLAKIPFEKKPGDRRKAPRGKLRFPVDDAVSARARGHQNLVGYCARIEKAHFSVP